MPHRSDTCEWNVHLEKADIGNSAQQINTRRTNKVSGRERGKNMHNRCMLSRDSVGLQIGLRMDQTQHANVRPPISKPWNTTVKRTFKLWDTTLSLDKTFRSSYKPRASFSETSGNCLSINRASYPRIKP